MLADRVSPLKLAPQIKFARKPTRDHSTRLINNHPAMKWSCLMMKCERLESPKLPGLLKSQENYFSYLKVSINVIERREKCLDGAVRFSTEAAYPASWSQQASVPSFFQIIESSMETW